MAKRSGTDNGVLTQPEARWESRFALIPRRWLVAAMALLLAPWIVVVWVFSSTPHPVTSAPRDAGSRETWVAGGPTLGKVGPWGQLETSPIVISPPLEFIPSDPDAVPSRAQWVFPRTQPAELAAFLEQIGVDAGTRKTILASAHPEPKTGDLIATPTFDTVASLGSDVRARLYLALAAYPQNARQQNAFRFFCQEPDAWFRGAPVRPETVELIRPLLYRNDGFALFADIDIVRSKLTDEPELRRLTKVLFRESTLLAKLRIPSGVNVETVAEYWGRGGRRTDLRPLLESIEAHGDEFRVDIAHLLPAFSRQHLYRYPQVTLADFDKPGMANCFWTAFNFFNDPPDDRFLDVSHALATLKRDYYLVQAELQLGDLVLYVDENANYYHAMVYIADGLVFGKNGNSTLAPWALLPLERIHGYYPQHAGGRTEYFRRKGL